MPSQKDKLKDYLSSRYLAKGANDAVGDVDYDSGKRSKNKKKKKKKKKKKSASALTEGGIRADGFSVKTFSYSAPVRQNAGERLGGLMEGSSAKKYDDSSSDSDESVARRGRHDSEDEGVSGWNEQKEYDVDARADDENSDSDLSVARRPRHDSGDSDSDSDESVQRRPKPAESDGDNGKGGDKKMMFSGTTAGLKSGAEFAKEYAAARIANNASLSASEEAKLGKNASTVYRNRQGQKVDMLKQHLDSIKDAEKRKFEEERIKYEWNTGAAQIRVRAERAKELKEVETEAFARYKDDEKMNKRRKDAILADDPMAAYMLKKRAKEKREVDPNAKPEYSGPPPPPNRFGIKPGYRWDGMDRSNGFEARLLAMRNSKTAKEAERYKYSTQDM